MRLTKGAPKRTALLLSLILISIILNTPAIEKLFLDTFYLKEKFADLQGILAPLESIRIGLNPYKNGIFDPGQRPHVYGPFWFALVHTGIGLKDTFWIGTFSAFLLIIISCLLTNPKTIRETIIFIVIAFSPPIVLAFTRMNNDVYVYLLIILSSWLITKNANILASSVNLINFGLKYYPAMILIYPLTFVKSLKQKRILAVGFVLCAIGLWVYWGYAYDGIKQEMPSPVMDWTFAGPNIFQELGASPKSSRLMSISLALLLGLILLIQSRGAQNIEAKSFEPNLKFHIFSQCLILLIGATIIKEAYSYRLVFILGMLPWVFECLKKIDASKKIVKVWLVVTIVSLWLEWSTWEAWCILAKNFPVENHIVNKSNILWTINLTKDISYWVFYVSTIKLFLTIGNYRYLLDSWGLSSLLECKRRQNLKAY